MRNLNFNEYLLFYDFLFRCGNIWMWGVGISNDISSENSQQVQVRQGRVSTKTVQSIVKFETLRIFKNFFVLFGLLP